jgi:hypothetical protein
MSSQPPRSPDAVTPPRRPGSVRRTTTHVCTRPQGLDGPVTVSARGRDLRTDSDGSSVTLHEARLEVQARFSDGAISRIHTDPPHLALPKMLGESAYSGFRRKVDAAMPGARVSGSLRYQLLDDVPIVLLLSGRVLRTMGIALDRGAGKRPLPVDICAGWVAGGTLLSGFTNLGPPLFSGPVASQLELAEDPLSWHHEEPVSPNTTRRRRRIDVWVDDGRAIAECFFRDSHSDVDGTETIVHEYTVRAAFDPSTHEIVTVEAIPGPLPYPECPAAAASSATLVGTSLEDLRSSVPETMVGPTTCTHLNDAFRSLEDAGSLLRRLP